MTPETNQQQPAPVNAEAPKAATTVTVRAAQPPKAPIPFGEKGVQLQSLEEAHRFATAVSLSGFAPKGMEKPESIMVAIQLGLELGLTPMAALQNIGVINGRPGIYGDAALALVRASGLLESYKQETKGAGDTRTVVVTVKRKGDPVEIISEFSVADAKLAGLWGKSGPWSQYPARMLLFRARGFALRDAFGDVLKGLRTTEELGDMPADVKNVTGTADLPAPGGLAAALGGASPIPLAEGAAAGSGEAKEGGAE